ncbi:MAG: hypothetical protein R2875_16210 [Desulfobacterales bacterium]
MDWERHGLDVFPTAVPRLTRCPGLGTKIRDAVAPVLRDLYESVANGTETRRVLDVNSKPGLQGKTPGRTGSDQKF